MTKDKKTLSQELINKFELISEMGIPLFKPATNNVKSTSESNKEELEKLFNEIHNCKLCSLGNTRTNFVFGDGNPDAKLVFIGEAPGEEEDMQGKPFVGAAGQLLTKIINAMGLAREEVFICNVLKCRPPKNRDPEKSEIELCRQYLQRQLEIIKPKVICTLGNFASKLIINTDISITKLRGKTYSYMGIKVIPTLHPASCLYHSNNKKLVWDDIKKIMQILKLPVPNKN